MNSGGTNLRGLILLESGPPRFGLLIRGKTMCFDLNAKSAARDHRSVETALLTKRRAVLTEIWQALRRLKDEERELTMLELRSIVAARGYGTDRGRAMTRKEVRRLVEGGLVAIGAHTVTHPILPELSTTDCAREISESKLACEAIIEGPVAGFAYPYGELDADASSAVMTAGFTFSCSGRYEPIAATSDVFALPRIQVRNCDGDAFERTLRSVSVGL